MPNGRADGKAEEKKQGILIGLIGPEPMIRLMRTTILRFPSFVPMIAVYEQVEEAIERTRELMSQVEVLLYSGPLAYQVCLDNIKLTVPAHYIPLTGSGLYRSLFRLDRRWGLSSFSVDTLPSSVFEAAFRELGQALPDLVFYPGGQTADTQKLVSFHEEQAASGNSKVALTALRSVAEELGRRGIPSEWILPTEQDTIVALERALLSTETRRSKEAQIVVGYAHADGFRRASGILHSEHDIQRLKLDIHRTMLEFAELLEGHLTAIGDEFLVVTTRGTFERMTGGYKFIPIAKQLRSRLGLTLSFGVGFGRSAHEAGLHARSALRHAQEAGGDACFIVREDQGLIGPLEMAEPHEAHLAMVDGDLLSRAEAAGLNRDYLSRILGQMSRTGKQDYNVHELAGILGITTRSTHRLLYQWEEAGLVLLSGEERGGTKGRPRHLYRFAGFEACIGPRPGD